MKRICIVGTGYVGLVTATCFAELGNHVVGLDIDEARIHQLRDGVSPIHEPGLQELIRRNLSRGRLSFTTSYDAALAAADFAFIAVGTPADNEGAADTRFVAHAAERIAAAIGGPLVVVNKSTVPIGTGDWVEDIIAKRRHNEFACAVVSNPEFMREGRAVHDFLHPDRVILGCDNRAAAREVAELYQPLGAPVMITDRRSAEMIKYASNAFLATKVSFINEVAAICEQVGADVTTVARGMGMDQRIGPAFLNAGIGWGGSCFPKDVKALDRIACASGYQPRLLRAVIEINSDQRRRIVQKLSLALGGLEDTVIGLLGLAFKPDTDDLREAPSLEIIDLLKQRRAQVQAYDPVAMPQLARLDTGVQLRSNPYETARGADALVVITEWEEFMHLDMKRMRLLMRRPVLVDGRNIYEPTAMRDIGFIYRGVGRRDKASTATPEASGAGDALQLSGALTAQAA